MTELDQDQVADLPVGERLRLAREAKEMTLDEIASTTRIPVRHLQHIESGDWDALPAITYSIGFARSYATAVGLDAAAIGAELRQQLGGARRTGAVSEYHEAADPARVPPRWLALAAALVAIALVIGYLIFRSGVDSSADPPQTGQAPPPVATSAPPQRAAPADVTGQPVVLAATEEVWLRVYEAEGGEKLFEGTLNAGQQYRIPAGARRPQLLTGRPNVLRVTVGQTVIPPLGPAEQRVRDVSLLPADLVARAQSGAPPPPAPRQ